jgi:hypothetical protein
MNSPNLVAQQCKHFPLDLVPNIPSRCTCACPILIEHDWAFLLPQLMCSWLCTSAEGRLVLASPELTYLDAMAACAVGQLAHEREDLMPVHHLAICMQESLSWASGGQPCYEGKHRVANSCGPPTGCVESPVPTAIIFCAACDLAVHAPRFLGKRTFYPHPAVSMCQALWCCRLCQQ